MSKQQHSHDAVAPTPRPKRLFTFTSGGWVVLLTGVLTLAVFAWGLAPVVLKKVRRPPGDNTNIESYQFDLSNLAVPRDLVVPAMLHRDMVPAMTNPTHSGPTAGVAPEQRWKAMQRRNDPEHGKYLVSSDHIIGVAIGNQARAYPLSVMYVHEIINDTLSGVPIAVTYHWPCASAAVFDRRSNDGSEEVWEFAISGLVYNSNLLMYARNETRYRGTEPSYGGGNESLWCQLLGKPVSGRRLDFGDTLTPIPCEVVPWADWIARHPDTSVIDRDVSMIKRYKSAAPTQYFLRSDILFPVRPLAEAPARGPVDPKTRVLAVVTSEGRRVYPLPPATSTQAVEWSDTLGSRTLRFICDPASQTLRVECEPPDRSLVTINCFWFAWHAMYPEDELATMHLTTSP